MFTTESGLVKLWTSYITDGKKTINDVAQLSNLKEMVQQKLSM
ncbi:hypothetical protein [Vallitalea okinawensis]|nr:hypothetical protein [Vallitalea okinawensis]